MFDFIKRIFLGYSNRRYPEEINKKYRIKAIIFGTILAIILDILFIMLEKGMISFEYKPHYKEVSQNELVQLKDEYTDIIFDLIDTYQYNVVTYEDNDHKLKFKLKKNDLIFNISITKTELKGGTLHLIYEQKASNNTFDVEFLNELMKQTSEPKSKVEQIRTFVVAPESEYRDEIYEDKVVNDPNIYKKKILSDKYDCLLRHIVKYEDDTVDATLQYQGYTN